MKKTPRWYQSEACAEVIGALESAKNVNPVAAIVTGGGKSLLNAMLIERIAQLHPAARILCLAPSMELVKQNVEEAVEYLAPALCAKLGVYCAGLNMKDRLSQYIIGTPQSVMRSAKRFGRIDYVIWDEAHLADIAQKTAKNIVDAFEGARHVGMTATDFRMSGLKVVPLTQCGLFNAKVYDLTSGRNFNRLAREGHLSPIVSPSIRFPQVDTNGVKTKGGDFDEAELARRAMDVTRECVRVALDNAADRKHFMWFAVNIEHAGMIHQALLDCGESAVVIHGELDKSERVSGIDEYLKKEHRHVVSVAMLTTGFNARFVDCLVPLRPTRSLILWKQIVGRGLRPYPGKDNCLVLDAGGNFARHGAINQEVTEGDSRAGLWVCTDEQVRNPFPVKMPDGTTAPSRERSGIRFPINSAAQPEFDLRVLLGLMEPDAPGCNYLNDAEHMTCRQCGRPRQGFLSIRQRREKSACDPYSSDDTYEIHDEDSIVKRDEICVEMRQLAVRDMQITPRGNSSLDFAFATDFGPYKLALDFDRTSADNQFFAFSRKFFEKATGRKLPTEAYRVLLQKDLIPPPIDITLTKFEDQRIFITEIRWLRNDELHSFRYDPSYRV